MLLWADGIFIQILEGEAQNVRDLAARIRTDSRHRNFMVLLEQSTEHRTFADWSIGFKQLNADIAADRQVFTISRKAVSERMSDHDGGVLLETILAFGRDFLDEVA